MKIPASKVPAQVWADRARRRIDLDEEEGMLLSSWDDSKQVYRIGKELWDELRIDEADEIPVDALLRLPYGCIFIERRWVDEYEQLLTDDMAGTWGEASCYVTRYYEGCFCWVEGRTLFVGSLTRHCEMRHTDDYGSDAADVRRPELKEVSGDARFANLRGLDSRILFECRAPKGSFDWVEPGNVISERVFFKVDGDWYVDDVREADGAKAKRRERRRRDFYRNFSLRSFHPTKAFLDKWVRGMYGWKNVKPSDVVITRETCAEGIYYRVRKTVGKGDWFSVTSFGKR